MSVLSNVFQIREKSEKTCGKQTCLRYFFQKQNSNLISIMSEKNIQGKTGFKNMFLWNTKKVQSSSAIHVTENFQLLPNYEAMLKWNIQKSPVMSVKTPLTELIWKSIVRQFMGFYRMMPSNVSFVQCFSNSRKIWKDMQEANTLEIFFSFQVLKKEDGIDKMYSLQIYVSIRVNISFLSES